MLRSERAAVVQAPVVQAYGARVPPSDVPGMVVRLDGNVVRMPTDFGHTLPPNLTYVDVEVLSWRIDPHTARPGAGDDDRAIGSDVVSVNVVFPGQELPPPPPPPPPSLTLVPDVRSYVLPTDGDRIEPHEVLPTPLTTELLVRDNRLGLEYPAPEVAQGRRLVGSITCGYPGELIDLNCSWTFPYVAHGLGVMMWLDLKA